MFTQRYAFRKIFRAKGASPFETPTRTIARVSLVGSFAADTKHCLVCVMNTEVQS